MNTPIPHRPYQKIREDECLICLEILEGEIAEISCGHIFHYHCIQPWIAKKGVHRSCCLCEKNTEIINIINFPYQNEIKNNVKKCSKIQNISLPVSNHITHRNSSQNNQEGYYFKKIKYKGSLPYGLANLVSTTHHLGGGNIHSVISTSDM